MRDTFFGYYRPTEEHFSALWSTGTFVIDTNVLLGLYRYPKQARIDLLDALRRLSQRLWLPHQVLLEYQENRLEVISEQVGRYSEVKEALAEARTILVKKLDALQLKKRHSNIDPDSILMRTQQLFDTFLAELEELHRVHPRAADEDQTRIEIEKLIGERFGAPLADQDLKALYEEGKKRYEQHRPPGYLDKGKSREGRPAYFLGDVPINREFGDLIIWQQMINEAKSRSISHLAFVTDDDKEDWWWKQSGQTIGPRPELINEMHVKAGVSVFYMYNSARFLEHARRALGATVQDDSIAQVRDIAKLQTHAINIPPLQRQREIVQKRCIQEWLGRLYPNAQIIHKRLFPEVVITEESRSIGYEVKFIREGLPRSEVRHWVEQACDELLRNELAEITFVIVASSEQEADELQHGLRGRSDSAHDDIWFIMGYIDDRDSSLVFVPLLPIRAGVKY